MSALSTRPAIGPSSVAAAPLTRVGVDNIAKLASRTKRLPSKLKSICTWLRARSALAKGAVNVKVALPIGVVRNGPLGQSVHSTYGV